MPCMSHAAYVPRMSNEASAHNVHSPAADASPSRGGRHGGRDGRGHGALPAQRGRWRGGRARRDCARGRGRPQAPADAALAAAGAAAARLAAAGAPAQPPCPPSDMLRLCARAVALAVGPMVARGHSAERGPSSVRVTAYSVRVTAGAGHTKVGYAFPTAPPFKCPMYSHSSHAMHVMRPWSCQSVPRSPGRRTCGAARGGHASHQALSGPATRSRQTLPRGPRRWTRPSARRTC